MFSHGKISKYYLLCRCDGSVIQAPSLWEGERTPNINGEERFLRGGLDGVQLSTQDDSLQSHTHRVSDSGHSHGVSDSGHTHGVSDPGHTHRYHDRYPSYGDGSTGYWGPKHGDKDNDRWDNPNYRDTSNVKSNVGVNSAKANIGVYSSTSNIRVTNVSGARTSGETRPKNIRVVYIMKVF